MFACLPPHSDRPLQNGAPPEHACAGLPELAALLERLENEAPTAEEWSREVARVAAALDCPRREPRLQKPATVQSQRLTLGHTREKEGDPVLETYRIYDEQFAIRRLEQMTWRELAEEAVAVWRRTLDDLSRTLLAREHYRLLLASAKDTLELLFPQSGVAPEGSPLQPLENGLQDRWRNGHHLFGLCCTISREYLSRARDADAPEEVGENLVRAAVHMAGSTAAMVYTTDFPAVFYQREIRPKMPPGFSGSQNSDFNHLKMAKGKLLARLVERWGKDGGGWPAPVRNGARTFRAVDLLDLDQHVLLAASRIGFAASLKQELSQEDASAIDGLRAMAHSRQHDFPV